MKPLKQAAIFIKRPLPVTENGNKYTLAIYDYFSQWTEAVPIKNQEATAIARIFEEY